jgi:hypothetical protein
MPTLTDLPPPPAQPAPMPFTWEHPRLLQSEQALTLERKLEWSRLVLHARSVFWTYTVVMLDLYATTPFPVPADSWFSEPDFRPSGKTFAQVRAAQLPDIELGFE